MIFNAEMVRAILDGRKTQTRRPLKALQKAVKFIPGWDINGQQIFVALGEKDHSGINPVLTAISCPFGRPGDRIWVRETFQGPLFNYEQMDEYLEDSSKFEKPEFCQYAADGGHRPEYQDADDNLRHGWRPSIHMPRWASRITLEITGVRVERLKSISDGDAIREGCSTTDTKSGDCVADVFARLWASIYGEESWRANPWVWVIEFRRVEGEASK
ncbi:morphogenetic protein [Pluralibacter gergoviae]|nr:Uncharacterised protein [Pluralibacter gergoviae]